MHPAALLKAIERPTLAQALEEATLTARAAGVKRLPALQ
jgi:hypothetical protein